MIYIYILYPGSQITSSDLVKMIPVAFCSAAAHSFSVFALSAGAVSFGQARGDVNIFNNIIIMLILL